jgi:hypothetical protein
MQRIRATCGDLAYVNNYLDDLSTGAQITVATASARQRRMRHARQLPFPRVRYQYDLARRREFRQARRHSEDRSPDRSRCQSIDAIHLSIGVLPTNGVLKRASRATR